MKGYPQAKLNLGLPAIALWLSLEAARLGARFAQRGCLIGIRATQRFIEWIER